MPLLIDKPWLLSYPIIIGCVADQPSIPFLSYSLTYPASLVFTAAQNLLDAESPYIAISINLSLGEGSCNFTTTFVSGLEAYDRLFCIFKIQLSEIGLTKVWTIGCVLSLFDAVYGKSNRSEWTIGCDFWPKANNDTEGIDRDKITNRNNTIDLALKLILRICCNFCY